MILSAAAICELLVLTIPLIDSVPISYEPGRNECNESDQKRVLGQVLAVLFDNSTRSAVTAS